MEDSSCKCSRNFFKKRVKLKRKCKICQNTNSNSCFGCFSEQSFLKYIFLFQFLSMSIFQFDKQVILKINNDWRDSLVYISSKKRYRNHDIIQCWASVYLKTDTLHTLDDFASFGFLGFGLLCFWASPCYFQLSYLPCRLHIISAESRPYCTEKECTILYIIFVDNSNFSTLCCISLHG